LGVCGQQQARPITSAFSISASVDFFYSQFHDARLREFPNAREYVLRIGITGYGALKLTPFWDPLGGDLRFEKIAASLLPK
jgi:hypothetical protein